MCVIQILWRYSLQSIKNVKEKKRKHTGIVTKATQEVVVVQCAIRYTILMGHTADW